MASKQSAVAAAQAKPKRRVHAKDEVLCFTFAPSAIETYG
jgi:hypothetical protein